VKTLCLVSPHKSMSTQVYKTLRDHTPALGKYRDTKWLMESGEPLFYSQQLFGLDQPVVYPTSPKDLSQTKKILRQVPDDMLIRVTGYPGALEGLRDKFCFLFLRRAVEDQVYLTVYGHRWMHALRAHQETKQQYEVWKTMYSNMTGSFEEYEQLVEPMCKALLHVERQHLAVADIEIWHHEVYQNPELLAQRLATQGYEFVVPSRGHLGSYVKSISERFGIRETPEWKNIQLLCRSLREA
jgi:hypothetical protein